MATIVFSAVGTALGGPIGGAIASLVGRQIDAALFGGPGREGPRLNELAVTTSSYGQPLPRHFGRMRVAGSIIWATELVEHSETQGGGKGAPVVTTYSYTANFAVALSSRRIQGVGRIWADGKLLRGAAGDLKVGGTLRVHLGEGDQPPDPLIAAAEGPERCPAFRDLAYVVFEDLDLSEYYNRIPALTFEVLADDAFDLSDVIGGLIDDAEAAVPLEGLTGFSGEGPLGESLRALAQVLPIEIDAGGEGLAIARGRLQEGAIPLPEAAVAVDAETAEPAPGFSRRRLPPPDRPPAVLRYFDTGRDYLPGVQRASGRPGQGEPGTIELPAALDADTARSLIERTARRIDWTRDRVFWRTAELDARVGPGAVVALPGLAGRWRVVEWEWRESGVELALERAAPAGADAAPQLPADAGRANTPVDVLAGTTALVAFELPLAGTTPAPYTARPFAAVSSAAPGWSGAALYADRGDGDLHPLGPSGRARSVIGTAASLLPPASPLLFDRSSRLLVTLIDPAMPLPSADMRQIASGANMALVGGEIIQFARAAPLGGGTWRLEGLLRGLAGTEAGLAAHAIGDPFVLLDSRLLPLDPAVLGSGAETQVIAIGRGDGEPVATPLLLGGITLRPLPPVHPRVATLADGTLRLAWTRRARGAAPWRDGVDMPLVEETERYLVTLGPLGAPAAQWTTAQPWLDLAPPLLAELSASAPGETLRVRQQGTHAISPPLTLWTLP